MRDVGYFLQGYGRLFLLRFLPFMLRCSIRDEYLCRIGRSSKCVENRECYACGCATPALMMADKACSARQYLNKYPCYPRMGGVKKIFMQMSTGWNSQTIDLGVISKGKSYFATFTYTGGKRIKSVTTSCGCTASEFNDDSVTLKLRYNSWGPRPLAEDITKHASVEFEDGSVETIRIIGKGRS